MSKGARGKLLSRGCAGRFRQRLVKAPADDFHESGGTVGFGKELAFVDVCQFCAGHSGAVTAGKMTRSRGFSQVNWPASFRPENPSGSIISVRSK